MEFASSLQSHEAEVEEEDEEDSEITKQPGCHGDKKQTIKNNESIEQRLSPKGSDTNAKSDFNMEVQKENINERTVDSKIVKETNSCSVSVKGPSLPPPGVVKGPMLPPDMVQNISQSVVSGDKDNEIDRGSVDCVGKQIEGDCSSVDSASEENRKSGDKSSTNKSQRIRKNRQKVRSLITYMLLLRNFASQSNTMRA